MDIHLPKNVLNAALPHILDTTHVRDCLPYLKEHLTQQSHDRILARLNNDADTDEFFKVVGSEKVRFIRFVAAMKILKQETVYDILMKEIRKFCTKKGKPEALQDYEAQIAKEVKKLESHDHEEEEATPAPPVSTETTSTVVSTLLPTTISSTDSTVHTPVSTSSSQRVLSSTCSLPTIPTSGSSTVPSSSDAVLSPTRDTSAPRHTTSMPNFGDQPQPIRDQGIGKLPGDIVRSLKKELQCCSKECGEKRLPMWRFLLKYGQLGLSFDTEEKMKKSKNPGKAFVVAMWDAGMTIRQLEQLFLEFNFQNGLGILWRVPGCQPPSGTTASQDQVIYSREQLPVARWPPAVTSPTLQELEPFSNMSIAGQHPSAMSPPYAMSPPPSDRIRTYNPAGQQPSVTSSGDYSRRQVPVEPSRYSTPTRSGSQQPVRGDSFCDRTSVKGVRPTDEAPAELSQDESNRTNTGSYNSLPTPYMQVASDSSSGFTRRASYDGNTPSLDRLIAEQPSKIPFQQHEAGPPVINFPDAARDYQEIPKANETEPTGDPQTESTPEGLQMQQFRSQDDDPPQTYSDACAQQNRSPGHSSEFCSEEDEEDGEDQNSPTAEEYLSAEE